MDKEYAGIGGIPDFTRAAAELAFDKDNDIQKNGLVCIHHVKIYVFYCRSRYL